LAYLYTNQSLMVNWNGCYSHNISNDVKQGGILSSILRFEKVGCSIGNVFLGDLEYDDNLCLLSPNRGSMSIMLKCCEEFSKEYDVVFNSRKSHLIINDERKKKMVPEDGTAMFERGNSTYSEVSNSSWSPS